MERLQSFKVKCASSANIRVVARCNSVTKRSTKETSSMKTGILIVFCALVAGVGMAAFAKAPHTKVAATHKVRQTMPLLLTPLVDSCRCCFGCWQDLFDRNNPNNLRSDYRSPPAQPAQF